MAELRGFLFVAILLIYAAGTAAFYLPGMAPHSYKQGENVTVSVNSLSPAASILQQPKSVIPYDYYYKRFHFCEPENKKQLTESLGSLLFGDRIYESKLQVKMNVEQSCEKLCSTTIPKEDIGFIKDRIREGYLINWFIDKLPAAMERMRGFFSIGFDLGQVNNNNVEINNHYDIKIDYHTVGEDFRVVGVLVEPKSLAKLSDCNGTEEHPETLKLKEESVNVSYTYSVQWKYSPTAWATRWDNYLFSIDPRIHWFSLINSIVIVLFLTGMVAMILLRALHKDISRYNQIEAQEDVQEDFGWKLVHGDVFRPPSNVMLLSVLLGSGCQLFCMTAVTLVFAVLGFLSPSSRGLLATVMIIFYMLFGYIAGYVSARVYKMFGGESWKKNVLMTAFFFPGIIFIILVTLNFFLISVHSSGAVPALTFFGLIAMWFLLSAPLSFIGSFFGFKAPKVENPVRTNQIPRQIPEQVFYLRPLPSILMGGVLPFGAIFIELHFIMSSIWGNRVYYLFGFAAMVFVVLTITCSEVTILLCYFHLCSEDYHWSWRAFLTSGASGLYIFAYSVFYYHSKLQIDNFASAVIYFGWSGAISLTFLVLSGAIGYFACLAFIRKIFSSIKVD